MKWWCKFYWDVLSWFENDILAWKFNHGPSSFSSSLSSSAAKEGWDWKTILNWIFHSVLKAWCFQYCLSRLRKMLVSVIFFLRNSGAGNGCANVMGAWKNAFFLEEKPMPIKFLVLGGGDFRFFFGGGSADSIFTGARIFLSFSCPNHGGQSSGSS